MENKGKFGGLTGIIAGALLGWSAMSSPAHAQETLRDNDKAGQTQVQMDKEAYEKMLEQRLGKVWKSNLPWVDDGLMKNEITERKLPLRIVDENGKDLDYSCIAQIREKDGAYSGYVTFTMIDADGNQPQKWIRLPDMKEVLIPKVASPQTPSGAVATTGQPAGQSQATQQPAAQAQPQQQTGQPTQQEQPTQQPAAQPKAEEKGYVVEGANLDFLVGANPFSVLETKDGVEKVVVYSDKAKIVYSAGKDPEEVEFKKLKTLKYVVEKSAELKENAKKKAEAVKASYARFAELDPEFKTAKYSVSVEQEDWKKVMEATKNKPGLNAVIKHVYSLASAEEQTLNGLDKSEKYFGERTWTDSEDKQHKVTVKRENGRVMVEGDLRPAYEGPIVYRTNDGMELFLVGQAKHLAPVGTERKVKSVLESQDSQN